MAKPCRRRRDGGGSAGAEHMGMDPHYTVLPATCLCPSLYTAAAEGCLSSRGLPLQGLPLIMSIGIDGAPTHCKALFYFAVGAPKAAVTVVAALRALMLRRHCKGRPRTNFWEWMGPKKQVNVGCLNPS